VATRLTNVQVASFFAQAEYAARWFADQRDDHTYLCSSRLGGVMFDTCDCAVMPT
jgi:hypothetical protein